MKKKRLIGFGLTALAVATVGAIGLTSLKLDLVNALFNRDVQSSYTLTLNSSNKVTSAGDKVQKTALNNNVTFTYANVSSSTSGHVTLNDSGTLVNKDWIRSITAFTCTFTTGALNVKASYGGDVWNNGFNIESGHRYEMGSAPYYLKFTATGSTLISSIVYEYSCVVNPNAHEGETGGGDVNEYVKVKKQSDIENGQYLIVFETTDESNNPLAKILDGTASDEEGNYVTSSFANDVIPSTSEIDAASVTIASMTGGYSVRGTDNYYIYHTGSKNAINFSSDPQANTIAINESTHIATIEVDSYHIRFNNASNGNRFRYYTTASNVYLYKLVTESGAIHYDTPKDCVGFTATDSKATSYKTTDIFDNDNGLSVVANFNDGTTEPLSKGGANGYSYIIKDANDNQIDTSAEFGGTRDGIYILVVSYKDYIPQEIQLNVTFVVKLTGIVANCSTLIYNTAQKLSDFTSSISADLSYNKITHNQTGVPYGNFAANKISLVLLDPGGVTHDINTVFGTAGTWTIKIVSDEDATIFDTEGITVNAIPVQTVSISGAAATLQEDQTMQLTANVTPNNATVQTVTWSSSNNSVASVNSNGLVTANSVGNVRITATANDGSQVYGYVDITVTAKPAQSEFDADMTPGENGSSVNVVFDGDDHDAIKVGTSKLGGDMTITVGAGATKLVFYAAAWNGVSGLSLNLTGATCSPSSVSLTADSGVANNSPFTLAGDPEDYKFEITLTGITSETTITLTTSTNKRFVLWGAVYYTTAIEPVYPTSITLTGDSSISIGGTTQLTVGYTPNDANVKNVTYSSDHTNYATVSETGLVTGVAAGTARITATAQTASGTTTAYIDITVSAIAVTGVSLNKTTLSLTAGNSETLTASISPSNATNKNVTWSSNKTTVATVSNGKVTAVSEGTATITVTTVDGNKTATCLVTVSASSSAYAQDIINNAATTGDLGNTGTTTWHANFSITLSSGAAYVIHSMGTKNTSNALQWNANGFLYSTASGGVITSISAVMTSGKTITVYGSNTAFSDNSGGTEIGTITGSDSLIPASSYEYIRIKGNNSSTAITSITIEYGTPEPTNPTGITVSPSSVELAKGGSKQLSVSYTPTNANQNKDVTWTRYSGSSNITVDSTGKVTVSSSATAGDTAVIRATLNFNGSIYSQCTVTVVEQQLDDQTILIYMCGSDLESNGQTNSNSAAGYASGDIQEILKVSNQPDDVNVVIETGGAKCWKSYGINAKYLERYHVANKQLVRDSQETKASMGKASTLQSFITWGVQTYPADRISLILWNHGGAMRGVCYDENANSDSLTNSEVKSAVGGAFSDLGRSTSDKFEWIGYDACLMQVQDIAEFNSTYFNYMVASEESEAGAGWDYDNWVDDAYAKKSTEVILKAIVDSFLSEQGYSSDQTLSYLSLSYMAAYKTAWEAMAVKVKTLISNKNEFQTMAKTVQYYGTDSYSEGYSYFGIFDAKDFLNKMKSKYSGATTEINAAITAFGNLVKYSQAGSQAGNSYGLCCYFPMSDGSGYTCETSTYYTASETNFSSWRSIVTTYGTN